MGLIKFSKKATADEKVYEYVSAAFLEQLVYYILNSKFRQATNLVPWLKKQVDTPTQALLDEAEKISSSKDQDLQMFYVLKHVKNTITYTPDDKVWSMPEYWQTADETLSLKTGDCEDGAILMYVLARLKGISANRLFLFAGDVVGGGHCWLGYRSNQYPLNYDFMDWCYWYKGYDSTIRNKFYVTNTNIFMEYTLEGNLIPSNYTKMWFAFNELDSFKSFTKK